MAEHHTQGRQGQGSRRRGNNGNRHHRQRVPRPEAAPKRKPSFLERVLSFFGFKKKDSKPAKADKKAKDKKQGKDKERKPQTTNKPPQKVRVAKTNNNGGNPGAKGGRRRANSTPPTDKARLYVGNLSYEATESELEDLFKGFGNVRSVEIIYNPRTYKSKGYAFVEMYQLDDARRAAEVLHGQPFMGRELMVSAASEKPEGYNKPEGHAGVAKEENKEEAPAPTQETPATEEP